MEQILDGILYGIGAVIGVCIAVDGGIYIRDVLIPNLQDRYRKWRNQKGARHDRV